MAKSCYVCNKEFEISSLKTSRSRFNIMGLTPPTGMGEMDRVCSNCLKIIHDKELKQIKISQIKRDIQR